MTKSEHRKRNTILNLIMLAALIGFLVWGQEGDGFGTYNRRIFIWETPMRR